MNSSDGRHGDGPLHLTDDLRLHGRGDKKLLVAAVVLLVVSTAAIFAVRPVYRHHKTERAKTIAREITELLDAGVGTNSLREVRLMIGLAPGEESVLRAAARYCTTNRLPEAVTYWAMLLESFPGTREDHLASSRIAMDLGRYEVATRELGKLLQRPGGDVEAARLALRLSLKRGVWDFAVRMADHVLELAPGDAQTEVWRALALIRSGQAARVEEAKGALLALLVRPGAPWREAADALLEAPFLTRAEAGIIRRRATENAPAGVEDRLRILTLDWLLDPGQRTRTVQQALAIAAAADNPADLDLSGRWLIEHEASEALLGRFPLEACKGDKVKMRIHILALAKLGRWDEVSEVARLVDTGLEPHIATVMIVAAARSRPKAKDEADAKAVLADRQLTVPDLAVAAQLAEEHGLNEAAIYLLEFLLDEPATMPEAANHILMLADRVDRLVLRRRALDRLVNAFPKDASALQQLGYVEAVLGGGDQEVVERVGRLPGAATNQFSQLVLAFGEIRQGLGEQALARLAKVSPPDEAVDPRVHLAYAAASGLANDPRGAKRHALLADQGRLKLEERALISRWLPDKAL